MTLLAYLLVNSRGGNVFTTHDSKSAFLLVQHKLTQEKVSHYSTNARVCRHLRVRNLFSLFCMPKSANFVEQIIQVGRSMSTEENIVRKKNTGWLYMYVQFKHLIDLYKYMSAVRSQITVYWLYTLRVCTIPVEKSALALNQNLKPNTKQFGKFTQ